MMETKKCTKCGVVKELGGFYTQKRGLFGLNSICKTCVCAYRKLKRHNGLIPLNKCSCCGINVESLQSKYCKPCKRKVKSACSAEIRAKNPEKEKVRIHRNYQKHAVRYRELKRQKRALNRLEYNAKQVEYNKSRAVKRFCEGCKAEINYGEKRVKFCKACAKKMYVRNSAIIAMKYYNSNIDKARNKQNIRHRKNIYELSDYYVASNIRGAKYPGLKLQDIPKEVIETKRITILIKRELKN